MMRIRAQKRRDSAHLSLRRMTVSCCNIWRPTHHLWWLCKQLVLALMLVKCNTSFLFLIVLFRWMFFSVVFSCDAKQCQNRTCLDWRENICHQAMCMKCINSTLGGVRCTLFWMWLRSSGFEFNLFILMFELQMCIEWKLFCLTILIIFGTWVQQIGMVLFFGAGTANGPSYLNFEIVQCFHSAMCARNSRVSTFTEQVTFAYVLGLI